jgi:hypothetical protein
VAISPLNFLRRIKVSICTHCQTKHCPTTESKHLFPPVVLSSILVNHCQYWVFVVIVILLSCLCRLVFAFFIFIKESGNFFKTNFLNIGFARSLTKLWLELWQVGLWQCAYKLNWLHFQKW